MASFIFETRICLILILTFGNQLLCIYLSDIVSTMLSVDIIVFVGVCSVSGSLFYSYVTFASKQQPAMPAVVNPLPSDSLPITGASVKPTHTADITVEHRS